MSVGLPVSLLKCSESLPLFSAAQQQSARSAHPRRSAPLNRSSTTTALAWTRCLPCCRRRWHDRTHSSQQSLWTLLAHLM
jgi:hypothetical protein